MRRIAAALLLTVWLLGGVAAAAPEIDEPPVAAAPAATVPAAEPIDAKPEKVVEQPLVTKAPPSRKRKIRAAATLAGIYAAFAAWSYVAWYQEPIHEFRYRGDPSDGKLFQWLGVNTYAGGADKLGHAWATMGLARVGTELLHQWGGYSKMKSAIIGTALSEGLFLVVEVIDGFHYTFSSGDLAFNTLGAALAFGQSIYPQLDDLVDFRVDYLPSKAYRALAAEGDPDYAEDYSGQTYVLAFHLGGIPKIRNARYGLWSQFVDVNLGWKTRGYKPDPPWDVPEEMPDYDMTQTMFVGVNLNVQGVFDYLLRDDRAPTIRKLTHGFFELYSVPFTTLPVLANDRKPTEPIGSGGPPE